MTNLTAKRIPTHTKKKYLEELNDALTKMKQQQSGSSENVVSDNKSQPSVSEGGGVSSQPDVVVHNGENREKTQTFEEELKQIKEQFQQRYQQLYDKENNAGNHENARKVKAIIDEM